MSRPLAAHALAIMCIVIAGVVLCLHLMHFRRRRDIYIPHPPGTIASAVALTSRSGFGDLLMPYDDEKAMSRALAPLRFCLDGRTGAVVVDDEAIAFAGEMRTPAMRDETTMTLIGKGQQHQREDSSEGERLRA
jgi:hypothetical protein